MQLPLARFFESPEGKDINDWIQIPFAHRQKWNEYILQSAKNVDQSSDRCGLSDQRSNPSLALPALTTYSLDKVFTGFSLAALIEIILVVRKPIARVIKSDIMNAARVDNTNGDRLNSIL